SGGTFKLSFTDPTTQVAATTGPISYLADGPAVQAALQSIAALAGNVQVTGLAGGPWSVEFINGLANQNVPQLAISNNEVQEIRLSGATVTPTFTLSFG